MLALANVYIVTVALFPWVWLKEMATILNHDVHMPTWQALGDHGNHSKQGARIRLATTC